MILLCSQVTGTISLSGKHIIVGRSEWTLKNLAKSIPTFPTRMERSHDATTNKGATVSCRGIPFPGPVSSIVWVSPFSYLNDPRHLSSDHQLKYVHSHPPATLIRSRFLPLIPFIIMLKIRNGLRCRPLSKPRPGVQNDRKSALTSWLPSTTQRGSVTDLITIVKTSYPHLPQAIFHLFVTEHSRLPLFSTSYIPRPSPISRFTFRLTPQFRCTIRSSSLPIRTRQ